MRVLQVYQARLLRNKRLALLLVLVVMRPVVLLLESRLRRRRRRLRLQLDKNRCNQLRATCRAAE